MKKPLAIRIDAELLATMRGCARRDNRTPTNFVETALRRRIEGMVVGAPESRLTTRTENT